MPKKIKVLGVEVEPIEIREKEQPVLYERFSHIANFKVAVHLEIAAALKIMLDKKLTLVPERKAVCLCQRIFRGDTLDDVLIAQAGDTFPTDPPEFAPNCIRFCQEKVDRTFERILICSHVGRNPEKKEYGGSARLVFRLISNSGEETIFTFIAAPSGLKEWEDLTLCLAGFYRMGLIHFEDRQVQDILAAADASVSDEPVSRPEGQTITEYTRNVFNQMELAA